MDNHPADAVFIESLDAIHYRGNAEALLRKLKLMYEGPLRFYHTWDAHVRSGLAILDTHQRDINDFPEVVVAWGFHDCICNPSAPGNERASSEYCRGVLEEGGVLSNILVRQDGLIMATTHATDLMYAPWAQQHIADLDLTSLGAPPVEFRKNTWKLRKEAKHQDDVTFCAGVKAFFQSLLKRPSIFYSPLFRNTYEGQAQENLQEWLNE